MILSDRLEEEKKCLPQLEPLSFSAPPAESVAKPLSLCPGTGGKYALSQGQEVLRLARLNGNG